MRFLQSRWGAVGGLAEVTAVFVLGSVIANMLFASAGVTSHPLARLAEADPDLIAISADLAKILMLQYAGWLGLALVFSLIVCRNLAAERGFTFGGRRVVTLLGIGILAWAAGDFANKLLWIVDTHFDVGQSVPWREALIHGERTPGWWLVMAVGSFGLVPVLEEVFWRGYVQSRFTQSFGAPAAIVITAVMFTLSHAQYHQTDAYHLATITSVFISSLVLGWIYHKTQSLVPPIIMHAMLNFPVGPVSMYMALGIMLAIIVLFWSQIRAACSECGSMLSDSKHGVMVWAALVWVAALMLGLSQNPTLVILAGYAAAPIAIVLLIPLIRQRWFVK